MGRLPTAGVLGVAMAAALPAVSRADGRVTVSVVIAAHHERGAWVDGGSERDDRGRSWRDTAPAWRYGYDRGWRDGSERGHSDARSRRGPDLRRHGGFRDADNGYKRWMGPRPEFSAGYRDGFAAGYRRAYLAARPSWRDRARTRWEPDRYRYDDRR